MALKLYKADLSPPTRSVYLTAAALGVKLAHTDVDFQKLDHLKTEFTKLNPQHTVPTLDDNGKIIWDSHAINVYLVSKYAQDDVLYPKDLYKRAVVDQRLHFDSGVLFPLIRLIVRPMALKGLKIIPENLVEEVGHGYRFLEKFLEGRDWVAGDGVTLADFSLLSSVTSLDVLVPIKSEKYPRIVTWIKRAEQLPYYYVTQKGLKDFRNWMRELME